jgi:hypothetical protein
MMGDEVFSCLVSKFENFVLDAMRVTLIQACSITFCDDPTDVPAD